MAKNIEFVGGEKQINFLDPLNDVGDDNGVSGDQVSAQVAALSNGNFVVVYENDFEGSDNVDILAAEFDANGELVPGSILRLEKGGTIDEPDGGQYSPSVTANLSGGYVAVWENAAESNRISLAVVAPGTTSEPGEFVVDDSDEGLFDPQIATFADGSYIVTYTANFSNSGDLDTRYAIVNSSGDALLAGPSALGESPEDEWDTSVATSGNLAAVVFTSEQFDVTADMIFLRTVDSSGNVIDSETVAETGNQLARADVAALSDGRFVIVWHDQTAGDVFGRIYDPSSGTFSGEQFTVTDAPGFQDYANVTGLADGSFLVTWDDVAGTLGDPSSGVHARRFDANGVPLGDEFLLNTGTSGNQWVSSLATNSDGFVFAVWENGGTEGTTDYRPFGIQGQVLNPITENVLTGTGDADTLTGYGFDETIGGLQGADTLTGGGGADSFVFNTKLKSGVNVDTITDFSVADDTILLDDAVFKELKLGALKDRFFLWGKKAKDGNDHVIYNDKTGELIYDKNGDDSGGAKVFAVLSPGLDLSTADFFVV